MTSAELWALEHRLWLEGVPVYEVHLHPGCIMAFPGIGIMQASEALRGLQGAARWERVEMTERVTSEPADGVVVLGYRATGQRAEGEPYVVHCTSTYVADHEVWKLVQHQQTPAG